MKELELTVRLSLRGEYENTLTIYIEIPKDTSKEDEMRVMMEALYPEMKDQFGDYEEWSEGEMSWTLTEWEEL